MATEALVSDQTAQGHVEEVKLTDEATKIVKKETSPESKDLEEKDEEKIKAEDSTVVEAPATKLEDANVVVETQEDKKAKTAIEEVKKVESEDPKEENSSISESKEEAVLEPATEAPKKSVEEATDVSGEKLMQESVSETTEDPEIPELEAEEVTTTPEAVVEVVNTSAEVAAEEVNTAPAAAAEVVNTFPEAATEVVNTSAKMSTELNTAPEIVADTMNATPEKAAEEVSKTEETVTEPALSKNTESVVSETVKKSLGDLFSVKMEENTGSPKVEFPVTDSSKPEEVSEKVLEAVVPKIENAVVAEAQVKDLKEEEAKVTEEVPDGSNPGENVQNESTENVVKAEDKLGQEKTVEAEEAIVSDAVKTDVASQATEVSSVGENALKDEKPSLVETSRDIDVNAEGEKDVVEAPNEEVTVKSSQRQPNNIFSKMKQSMVKVKKAIIGKSPSSKTMSAEGKAEIK